MPIRVNKTICLLADNEFGVLTRITALVRREGWNIQSLGVSVTDDPMLSQMLMTVECIDSTLPRVLGKLGKLSSVKKVQQITGDFDLSMELRRLFNQLKLPKEGGVHNG